MWSCVPGRCKGFRKGVRKIPKAMSSGAHCVGKVHTRMDEVQADGLRLGQLVPLMARLRDLQSKSRTLCAHLAPEWSLYLSPFTHLLKHCSVRRPQGTAKLRVDLDSEAGP